MGSSKRATAGLISFLGAVQTEGIQNALNRYNLGDLIGRSIEEVFLGLADYICPDGGSIDEGIARNAFIETIAGLAERGITDLNTLTVEQLQTIVEEYATHAIEARLCNDIGTKIIIVPSKLEMISQAQVQLHDYIGRSVSDAINSLQITFQDLTSVDTAPLVESIYLDAFTILQTLSEAES